MTRGSKRRARRSSRPLATSLSRKDLLHSIVMRAVEAESKSICAALRCHWGGPMARDKGPRTKKACMLCGRLLYKPLEDLVHSIVVCTCRFYVMVQSKLKEDLPHSIVMRAEEAESKGICAALRYHLGGPLSRGKGPRTKVACMIYGMSW